MSPMFQFCFASANYLLFFFCFSSAKDRKHVLEKDPKVSLPKGRFHKLLGSLSNHDDDGNKNLTNLPI